MNIQPLKLKRMFFFKELFTTFFLLTKPYRRRNSSPKTWTWIRCRREPSWCHACAFGRCRHTFCLGHWEHGSMFHNEMLKKTWLLDDFNNNHNHGYHPTTVLLSIFECVWKIFPILQHFTLLKSWKRCWKNNNKKEKVSLYCPNFPAPPLRLPPVMPAFCLALFGYKKWVKSLGILRTKEYHDQFVLSSWCLASCGFAKFCNRCLYPG